MKLVVRMPNWIGDAVMALPVLGSLAASGPDIEVWAAGEPWVGDLLSPGLGVKGSLTIGRPKGLKGLRKEAAALKERRFDGRSSCGRRREIMRALRHRQEGFRPVGDRCLRQRQKQNSFLYTGAPSGAPVSLFLHSRPAIRADRERPLRDGLRGLLLDKTPVGVYIK